MVFIKYLAKTPQCNSYPICCGDVECSNPQRHRLRGGGVRGGGEGRKGAQEDIYEAIKINNFSRDVLYIRRPAPIPSLTPLFSLFRGCFSIFYSPRPTIPLFQYITSPFHSHFVISDTLVFPFNTSHHFSFLFIVFVMFSSS
jgi:hypothetical protein